jgi:hypothetical protein
VQAFEVRHTRFRSLPKTHFQYAATTAAMNLVHVVNWLPAVSRLTHQGA